MNPLQRLNSVVWERILRRLPDRAQAERLQLEIANSQVAQHALFLQYRDLAARARGAARLADAGFRTFSQADEDGLLLYVFAAIGFESRVLVDLGAALPEGSNTANLLCNWGFSGLLVDGDAQLAERSRAFYARHRDTWLHPPRVLHSWVTAENCNALLSGAAISGEIDLLSIDLDGVDYWVWRALDVVRPRVVVVECQDLWGAERSVTVPYRADFARPGADYDYCGASLPALVKLGHAKGYRLVGTNRYGYNAVFVRKGLAEEALPEADPAACLSHPRSVARRAAQAAAATRPWDEV